MLRPEFRRRRRQRRGVEEERAKKWLNKEVRESRYNSVKEMRRQREERGDEETKEVGPFMNKKVI